MTEEAPSRPHSPPSLANIYPLGENPTQKQLSFIRSHFEDTTRADFDRLSQQSANEAIAAFYTRDNSRLVATNNAMQRFYDKEAKRISQIGEASRTEAASSQSKTGQGPLIELDQTQDGTSAKSTGTAHQR
jgi:hypothetical protein